MVNRTKGSTRRCAACGGRAVRDTRRRTITYDQQSVAIDQSGWWCEDCGDTMLDSKDAAVADRAFATLKARVEGVLAPADIERVRKRLKLSQRKAGAILGGGARAFQRYEAGAVVVSKPMSHLLMLLGQNPRLLAGLTAQSARQKLRQRPRVDSRTNDT